MSPERKPALSDYLAVGLLSGATLSWEILLLRVFSYSQWHHFASLAVSLALLGFGAGGTLLALMGTRAIRLGDRLFLTGLAVSVGGMLLAFAVPHLVSVRPLFAVWDLAELGKLLVVDFISFIPFFGAALCIGQVFMRWPESTPRLYAANLLGSGAGALAASLMLAFLYLETALMVVPVVLLLTGALFGLAHRRMRIAGLLCIGAAIPLSGWLWSGLPELPLSDFKRLSYLLDLPDARLLERQAGLQSEVRVIRSDSIRISPGLSLEWTEAVPSQDALVLGADASLPLPRDCDRESFAYFPACLGSLPLALRPEGELLLLGTSTWITPAMVKNRTGVWVQNNAAVARLFEERAGLGNLRARVLDARGFLSSTPGFFPLIYLAGSHEEGDASNEDYLLTREGLSEAFGRLTDNGLIAIPLRLHNPPRYEAKALRLAGETLRQNGIKNPLQCMAMLRSMQDVLILVSKRPITGEETTLIRQFASRWGFDMAILGQEGGLPEEAAWYSDTVPSDNRPYFWRSMRWSRIPALLGELGRQGLIWLDWSLIITVAKLLVAALLAIILILLPLGRIPGGRKPITRPRVWAYFTALGLGFLLLEMAAFQRSILFLVDPVIAASLVFAVFLTGAGLGSLTSPALRDRAAPSTIFLGIIGTALLAWLLLEFAMDTVSGMALWIRLLAVATALAPLAWSLGQAFPWGLRQLDEDRQLIPWAWGINGFASVLAPPLATLLSVQWGQAVTWLAGGACYLGAWLVARSWARQWSWYR